MMVQANARKFDAIPGISLNKSACVKCRGKDHVDMTWNILEYLAMVSGKVDQMYGIYLAREIHFIRYAGIARCKHLSHKYLTSPSICALVIWIDHSNSLTLNNISNANLG